MTLKMRRFIDLYLGSCKGNASRAGLRAGYSHADSGRRLLRSVTVQDEIRRRTEATGMTSDALLARLSAIARADVGAFLRLDSRAPGGFRIDVAAAKRSGVVQALKKRGDKVEIAISDQIRALELLGRNLGLWKGPARDDASLLPAIAEAEKIARERGECGRCADSG
jgi:phage terminase small subunit